MYKNQSGFAGMILLLGTAVFVGVGYFFLKDVELPKLNIAAPYTFPEQPAYVQGPTSMPFDPNANIAVGVPPTTAPPPPVTRTPITPFVLEPLTITLTDEQFTNFVNTYKPADLPIGDITFTFSDNTIVATTIATSQIVQGPIKVVAIHENKWFKITKVYLGTIELPQEIVDEINVLVNKDFKEALAQIYLDGLQIESIKGNTMKLSVQAPKGLVNKSGSGVNLNEGAVGR